MIPGSTITYTLSATNTGQLPLIGATATDDLTAVTPFADVVTPLPAGLTRPGDLLTWAVPTVPVGATRNGQFLGRRCTPTRSTPHIHNLATPTSPGGTCAGSCADRPHHATSVDVGEDREPGVGHHGGSRFARSPTR